MKKSFLANDFIRLPQMGGEFGASQDFFATSSVSGRCTSVRSRPQGGHVTSTRGNADATAKFLVPL
jgi:hypothetical protein